MACLIIMGSVALLSVNINELIKDLESENKVVAFVDAQNENLKDPEQAKLLEDVIRSVPNVSDVKFVSNEEAMDNFMKNYDRTLMEGITKDTFRHRFVIELEHIDKMKETREALTEIPGIAKVNAQQDFADTFIKIRNIITGVSMALMVVLVFISMFIMSNTIKLATFSRREEIAIMKMVGASNGFIRLPFVVEGLVLGLLGGGLGFLAQWGLYDLITGSLAEALSGDLLAAVPFKSLMLPILVIYLGIGAIIGVFGGMNAIKNYLKV
jgi:cell division transport system permease protein